MHSLFFWPFQFEVSSSTHKEKDCTGVLGLSGVLCDNASCRFCYCHFVITTCPRNLSTPLSGRGLFSFVVVDGNSKSKILELTRR